MNHRDTAWDRRMDHGDTCGMGGGPWGHLSDGRMGHRDTNDE